MNFYISDEFILDARIYEEDAIILAAKEYASYCHVQIIKRDELKIKVAVSMNDKFLEHQEHIKCELLNFLLGYSITMKEGSHDSFKL